MRIGFWFDYDQTFTFVRLFRALRERIPAATASGFVVNARYWDHAVEGLPPGTPLLDLYALVRAARETPLDPEARARFRSLDERHRFGLTASSDRHLQKFTHEELIRIHAGLAEAFAAYLDRERPELFVFNCVASMYAHLFYELLAERGVPVAIPTHTGIGDLFHFFGNPYLTWPEVWATARRWREAPSGADAGAMTWARAYVDGLKARKPAYALGATAIEAARFRAPGPRRALRYLRNWARYDRGDPTLATPVERLRALVDYRLNRRLLRSLAEPLSALDGADFAYMPLHFEPEIATLTLSKHDQRVLIDLAARQLPLSWKLAVKDHPAMVAQRPATYFRELKARYPNLVVVDPGVTSQALLDRCRLVLTLSGTVVVEALAAEKPVIYTSRSRFSGFGIGTYAPDAIEFGPVLDRALAWKPDDAALVAAIAAIKHHSDSFLFAEPLGTPAVLDDQNIAAIADAMLRRLPVLKARAPIPADDAA